MSTACLTLLGKLFLIETNNNRNVTVLIQVNGHLKRRVKEKNTNGASNPVEERNQRMMVKKGDAELCHSCVSLGTLKVELKTFYWTQANIFYCLLDLHYEPFHSYINSMCPNWCSHPILYMVISSFMNHVIIHLIKPQKGESVFLSYHLHPSDFQILSIFLRNVTLILSLHSYLSCLISDLPCSLDSYYEVYLTRMP